MKNGLSALIAAGLTLLVGGTASAHISVDATGTADATTVATFGVGHGCEGFDTLSIEVKIPAGVTSVRPLFGGAFGKPVVNKDATGAVASVKWTKADVETADTNYYPLQIRMKLPNTPFATVFFPTTQVCRDPATNMTYTTEWAAQEINHSEDGPEPAPAMLILPAKGKGWNKFTTPVAIKDLAVFNDAQIVWAGNAAFSSNATTKDLIGKEPNTTVLSEIPANTEIWVKY
ncbi:MAG: DUF1775 domain-containing protein [Polyangiales bacterium]